MKSIPVRRITATQPFPPPTGRFSIRDLATLLQERNLIHDLHKHDFYFVLAVQQGRGNHEIDFVSYEIHDHTIFLLRPGQVHQLNLAAGSSGFLLEFDAAFYQPQNSVTDLRWKKASAKNFCAVETARFERLHAILQGMFREYNQQEAGYNEAIRAWLDLFFIEYLRQSRQPNKTAAMTGAYNLEQFEAFAQLLEHHITTLKSVTDYAGLLNLSAYQLNAITKNAVGKTVSELINEQILLEAKRQLLATTIQVKEIADQLGYEDVNYFIRFFRKHTGFTPEAFRKNLR